MRESKSLKGLAPMNTLWDDFINSDWHDYRGKGPDKDRLLQSGWLEELLEAHNMQGPGPVTEETLVELQQLRGLLQQIIQTLLEHRQPDERERSALNAYLGRASLYRKLTGKEEHLHLELVPYQRDWSWFMSEVAASFSDILVHHDPTRIKLCENPACRWVYYDESKNSSRRWCDEPCANIMRVRRFRERQRQQ